MSLRDFAKFGTWTKIDGKLTTQDIRNWKTSEGIGLGSSEEDVLKAYGKPSAEKKLDAQKPRLATKGLIAGYREGDHQPWVGIKIIIYGPRIGEPQVSEFGMRDGKVSVYLVER